MRIQDASIYIVPTGYRRAVILELETDTGLTGIGEAGIAYGIGTEAAATMLKEMVERRVLGRDARPVELVLSDLYDTGFWTKGGGAIGCAAISAIDHALWDIKGKSLGVPVYELLGGPFEHSLSTYANGWWVGCDTPQEYAKAGRRMVDRGSRGLKFYPLGKPDAATVIRHPTRRAVDRTTITLAVRRMAALRDSVGDDVDIMLDLGGGLADDLLLDFFERIRPYRPAFIEEPADPGCCSNAVTHNGTHAIPIAAGERNYMRYGFQSLISAGLHILQPDVCNTGGIVEARKIAAFGETHNLRVAPHNYGSELATAIAAQFSACISNFMVLEIFPDFSQEPNYLQLLKTPLEARLEGGKLPLPTGPGLGVELHRGNVKPYKWAAVSCS